MIASLDFPLRVIAHRGASGYAPENTMAAFVKAAQLGIKWVEFDVTMDSLGQPIIFHDERLERVTNGKGWVHHYPYSYLHSLDAGKWFNPIFSSEKILTLSTLMTFLSENKMNANVELKPPPSSHPEALVRNVLHTLTPYLNQFSRSQILFSSFSLETLHFLRRIHSHCQIGLLLHEWLTGWESIAEALQCVSIHVNEAIMTKEAACDIKKMNKKLLCYTVNSRTRAEVLFSWGIDAVFSDFPDKVCAY